MNRNDHPNAKSFQHFSHNKKLELIRDLHSVNKKQKE